MGSYVIEKALTEGWVETSDTGFNFTHSDTLMNAMFDRFSMKKKANNDRYDIYAELKDEIDDNRVVVFKIRQHEMTGCGYVEYTVKYKEKNWLGKLTERTDTAKFVIVNTTWGEESNYDIAYFPEGEIGTSIGNRWHFGITKYK